MLKAFIRKSGCQDIVKGGFCILLEFYWEKPSEAKLLWVKNNKQVDIRFIGNVTLC